MGDALNYEIKGVWNYRHTQNSDEMACIIFIRFLISEYIPICFLTKYRENTFWKHGSARISAKRPVCEKMNLQPLTENKSEEQITRFSFTCVCQFKRGIWVSGKRVQWGNCNTELQNWIYVREFILHKIIPSEWKQWKTHDLNLLFPWQRGIQNQNFHCFGTMEYGNLATMDKLLNMFVTLTSLTL